MASEVMMPATLTDPLYGRVPNWMANALAVREVETVDDLIGRIDGDPVTFMDQCGIEPRSAKDWLYQLWLQSGEVEAERDPRLQQAYQAYGSD